MSSFRRLVMVAASSSVLLTSARLPAFGVNDYRADHVRFACSVARSRSPSAQLLALDESEFCGLALRALEDLGAGRIHIDQETLTRRRPAWARILNPKALKNCLAEVLPAGACQAPDYELKHKETPLPISVIGKKEAAMPDRTGVTTIFIGHVGPSAMELSIRFVEPMGNSTTFDDSLQLDDGDHKEAEALEGLQLVWTRYFTPRIVNDILESRAAHSK
jgi:hypothetical protein